MSFLRQLPKDQRHSAIALFRPPSFLVVVILLPLLPSFRRSFLVIRERPGPSEERRGPLWMPVGRFLDCFGGRWGCLEGLLETHWGPSGPSWELVTEEGGGGRRGSEGDEDEEAARLGRSIVATPIDDGSDAIKKRRLLEYHAAGKALTQGAQHSAPAYDKSKVFGRATSSGAAFLRDGRAFWVAPKAPGASAAANSTPGRRYPNLNFRWALSEIQIGPV